MDRRGRSRFLPPDTCTFGGHHLAFPVPGLPCILDADDCDVAVGAVLSQVVDGIEILIAFCSMIMNSAQRNYCPTRRELLVVIVALQHFRYYLPVILRTDHHCLKWLKTFKHPEGILSRWIETLAEFDYEIEHRPAMRTGSRRPSANNDEARISQHLGLTSLKEPMNSLLLSVSIH